MKVAVTDRREIRGRGLILTVKADFHYPTKVGDIVEDADGERYKITGIEQVKYMTYPPTYGDTIGLIVTRLGR